MTPPDGELGDTIKQLRRTPSFIKRAADGLTDAQLREHPDQGSWSVLEVLAHLRGAADVQGGWIEKILAGDTPTIRYASPRTGMRKTDYETRDFHGFLREFARQRNALVARLTSLSPADWNRQASFTGTTPGWTQTVFEIARGIATHEHAHHEQIAGAASIHRSARNA